MERIKDSASNNILTWSSKTSVATMGSVWGTGAGTDAGTQVPTFVWPFDLRGVPTKVFTIKNNGTQAFVNGSILTSHDGAIWQVVDGTTFNTLAGGVTASSKVIDPRGFYQFSGSCGSVNVITIQVSACSF